MQARHSSDAVRGDGPGRLGRCPAGSQATRTLRAAGVVSPEASHPRFHRDQVKERELEREHVSANKISSNAVRMKRSPPRWLRARARSQSSRRPPGIILYSLPLIVHGLSHNSLDEFGRTNPKRVSSLRFRIACGFCGPSSCRRSVTGKVRSATLR